MKSCFITSTNPIDARELAKVNLSAIPNEWNIKPVVSQQKPMSTETTSADLINAMSSKLSKSARFGNAKKTTAQKWFEMPKATMTPEVKSELTALKLKAYMDPKKFYKASDWKKLPERFQFGVMVEGGLKAVGGGQESQAAGTSNRTATKGRTLLQEAIGDEGVQAWTKKRFSKVNERQLKTAAFSKKVNKTKKFNRK